MAWVNLSDLLAPDKNFHGLLDTGERKFTLSWETHTKKGHEIPYDPEYLEKFQKELSAPMTLLEFSETEINSPEWTLNTEGHLKHFYPVLIQFGDDLEFVVTNYIDISDWLKTLPKDTLDQIGRYAFTNCGNLNKEHFNNFIKNMEKK